LDTEHKVNQQYRVNYAKSIVFSPNGSRIAIGFDDATVRIWDTHTGEILSVLIGHTDSVRSVAFSPDGTSIVSGSIDRDVRLWHTLKGTRLGLFRGHRRGIRSVAFSSDGSRVISICFASQIRIWDIESGQVVTTLEQRMTSIRGIVFSADTHWLISNSAIVTKSRIVDENITVGLLESFTYRVDNVAPLTNDTPRLSYDDGYETTTSFIQDLSATTLSPFSPQRLKPSRSLDCPPPIFFTFDHTSGWLLGSYSANDTTPFPICKIPLHAKIRPWDGFAFVENKLVFGSISGAIVLVDCSSLIE
jgi:WD40 repeat protein